MSPNTQALIEVAKSRRTYYALGRNAPVPDSEVVSLVNEAILHVPSSFNTQSTRLVVALGADHEKVWDIAADALKGLVATGAVPQETYDTQTKPKLDSFKAAYGTVCLFFFFLLLFSALLLFELTNATQVLFYEDPAHIKPLGEKFPAFASKFPEWADHSNAMHQWFSKLYVSFLLSA
jgi:predicted oxidoreductase (fatty acid repression mutant protein)